MDKDRKKEETIYLDIMVGGRFYRQVRYSYSPLFKIDFEDVVRSVLKQCPSLINEKNWSFREGKRIGKK